MKNKPQTIRLLRTITLLATAVLALNLLTASGIITNAAATHTGYLAQAPDDMTATAETTAPDLTVTTIEATSDVQADPCATIRSNEQIIESPLTTVSDTCIGADIGQGTISIDYMPDSFSFPLKDTSMDAQDSFSNDNPDTPEIDVTSGPEDILALHDYRNNGGFTVTLTTSGFESSNNAIPLRNLFVATTYPGTGVFETLDPALGGIEAGGIEYADGSVGAKDVAAGAFTADDLNLPESYAVSFDQNGDDIADIVELMKTDTGHVGRFSQAVSFLLKIPADQPAGDYQVKFTMDIITQ
jgi:hypothetical protein